MAITDIAKAVSNKEPSLLRAGSPRCCVCNALDDLPAAEAAALVSLLSDTNVRYNELQFKLAADKDYPLDLHHEALRKHARGRCSARVQLRASTR